MKRVLLIAAVLPALIGAFSSDARGQGGTPAAQERFVLNGVVLFDDGSGLAWLQEQTLTGDRVVSVRPGETIGQYRLTKILEDRVELQGPAGSILVPVYNASPSSPGGAVASASPSGGGRASWAAAPPRAGGEPASLAAPGPAVSPWTQGQGGNLAERMRALTQRRDAARGQLDNPRTEPARGEAAGGRRAGGSQQTGSPASSGSGRAPSSDAPAAAAAPTGNAGSGQAGTGDVVYPAKRQTFQSILGLD